MSVAQVLGLSVEEVSIMKPNKLAEMIALVTAQARSSARIAALRELSQVIDQERQNVIARQDESEYNRGLVDGLNLSYMATIHAAGRRENAK